jgi:hypothetical protein
LFCVQIQTSVLVILVQRQAATTFVAASSVLVPLASTPLVEGEYFLYLCYFVCFHQSLIFISALLIALRASRFQNFSLTACPFLMGVGFCTTLITFRLGHSLKKLKFLRLCISEHMDYLCFVQVCLMLQLRIWSTATASTKEHCHQK